MIILVLIERRKTHYLLYKNGSSIEQTWIPFTQGCFAPNLVEIGPEFLKIFKFRHWFFTIS